MMMMVMMMIILVQKIYCSLKVTCTKYVINSLILFDPYCSLRVLKYGW